MAKHEIGGETFSSKEAVRKRCSGILKAPKNCPAEVPQADIPFVMSLLQRHQTAADKIGCGVAHFYVNKNEYGGRGFWLERTDGTRTDFGIERCLMPPNKRADVLRVLRYLVTEQIIEFRDKSFEGKAYLPCAITGKPVSKDASHVDRQPPNTFIAIAEDFVKVCGFSWDDIAFRPHRDGDTHDSFVDPEISEAWLWYHGERAVLRIVDAKANMSQRRGNS